MDAKENMDEIKQQIRTIFNTISVDEVKQILTQTHIDELSFKRWCSGETFPRQSNLVTFLTYCSEALKARLFPLVKIIYPSSTKSLFPSATGQENVSIVLFKTVIAAVAETPHSLRYETIVSLVLNRIRGHLEAQHVGMIIRIFHCVEHPENKNSVICLWEDPDIGELDLTGKQQIERHGFFGEESLPGRAVARLKVLTEDQSIAIPLLRGGDVGGCLVLEQCLCNELILKDYARSLALGLNPQKFYPSSSIRLVLMPPREQQQLCLASIPARKIQAMREHHFSSEEADTHVLQQAITYLAQLALQ